jgi:hypothetical protein
MAKHKQTAGPSHRAFKVPFKVPGPARPRSPEHKPEPDLEIAAKPFSSTSDAAYRSQSVVIETPEETEEISPLCTSLSLIFLPRSLLSTASPVSLPETTVLLDAPFSQKVPSRTREDMYTGLRKELHRVFRKDGEMWNRLGMEGANVDVRCVWHLSIIQVLPLTILRSSQERRSCTSSARTRI